MKNSIILFVILCLLHLSCTKKRQGSSSITIPTINMVGKKALHDTILPIQAPFSMNSLKKPIFPSYTINIKEKGATENKLSTLIIQNCIEEVHSKGGGTVIIPKGKWPTGRITLKSNVNLHFNDGAELYFSGELKDYQPAVFTRIEGIEVMSLGACIYANNATNIAITGNGRLFGPQQGPVREYLYTTTVIEKVVPLDKPTEERKFSGMNGEGYFLPMFISPIHCKNVLIEGISLQNTAFWNIVPTYCENVIIRGVEVNSVGIQRGDGIDIESSKNVLIEYCTLSCGDDCFTLKAGRGEDGLRIGRPTENVIIRYCLAKEGHGGITCGSETAAGIKNLYVHDCVLDNTGVGIRFKTRRPRGGGGNNLHYERIRMNLRYTAFKWDMLGSVGSVGELAQRLPKRAINPLTPEYKDIFIQDVIIDTCSNFMRVIAIPESPLKNVQFNNIDAHCNKLISIWDAKNIHLKNCTISSPSDTMLITNTHQLSFDNVSINTPNKSITIMSDSISKNQLTFTNCPEMEINTFYKN